MKGVEQLYSVLYSDDGDEEVFLGCLCHFSDYLNLGFDIVVYIKHGIQVHHCFTQAVKFPVFTIVKVALQCLWNQKMQVQISLQECLKNAARTP